MNKQSRVTPKRGLPVDRTDESQKVVTITGETVQLQYLNSGVLTNDAGEAAGTIVVGKLNYGLILDSIGAQTGGLEDSSLSFTCDAFTTELELDPTSLEVMDYMTLEDKLNGLLESASNWEYYIDHRNGVIYGKKNTTTSTMTSVSYKISSNAASVTIEAWDIQIGNVGVLNVAESPINPATEEKQDTGNTTLANILSMLPNIVSDPEVLVTAQDLTTSYTDFWAEINMSGYNCLGVYIITDVNDSENVNLKVLGKHESGGVDEYEIDGLLAKSLWTTWAADSKLYYTFKTDGTIPFLQLQAIAGVLGTTAGNLSIVITKSFI